MPQEIKRIRIDYDDDMMGVIDKVNDALESHNLKFIEDNEQHDGFMLYDLSILNKPFDWLVDVLRPMF